MLASGCDKTFRGGRRRYRSSACLGCFLPVVSSGTEAVSVVSAASFSAVSSSAAGCSDGSSAVFFRSGVFRRSLDNPEQSFLFWGYLPVLRRPVYPVLRFLPASRAVIEEEVVHLYLHRSAVSPVANSADCTQSSCTDGNCPETALPDRFFSFLSEEELSAFCAEWMLFLARISSGWPV